MSKKDKYVLMTAARNEAAYIEDTIQSVVAQTRLPQQWVIVSDGSTDNTDKIIQDYEKKHPFIIYVRKQEREERLDFTSKVFALRQGYMLLTVSDYDFIGNLDADITFDESYFKSLIEEFQHNKKLGIAGGLLYEKCNGQFMPRALSEKRYVPGAVQLFRRGCYEQMGGYIPSKWGGEDTIAVITARMNGWETKSIRSIPAYHHKVSEISRGYLKERFRSGVMFHAMGSHSMFELFKSLRQMTQKPYFLGGLARMCGFIWAGCSREIRPVEEDFIKYLRKEQWKRLKNILSEK